MKKLLLFVFTLCFVFAGFSQTRKVSTRVDKNVARTAYHKGKAENTPAIEKPYNNLVERPLFFDEIQLGASVYDQQTSSSISNRFYMHEDGTMAFVWTRGMTQTGSWPDRGTGYNYFDGASWGPEPTARIETSTRTGWPSYAPLGADGELIFCHQANDLEILKRTPKGSGAWTQTHMAAPNSTLKLTWPKIVTNGPEHNTIHLLVNTYNEYNGQAEALLYYRSQDAGSSWDISAATIPGTGPESYFDINADTYVWAEPRANTLAFVLGNSWTDLNLFKSVDNGDTWSKTRIWEHPYPLFDWDATITHDTIRCPESITCAIDGTGKVHVAFGLGRVAHEAVGNGYNYWPYTDGIGYWAEGMPEFTAVNQNHALDSDTLYATGNLIGWSLDLDNSGYIWDFADLFAYGPQCGISTMPQLSIDADNNVFLAYSATAEGYVGDQYNYKHIFLRYGGVLGSDWQYFMHLNDNELQIFDECIVPLLTANTDDYIHVVYNVDEQPGRLLDEDAGHLANQNRQLYSKIPKWMIGVGTPDANENVNATVSSPYPNPFRTSANIDVNLTKSVPVSIRIYTVSGQELVNTNYGIQSAGAHVYKIDGSRMSAGIYYYTLTIGQQQYTRKMIVK